jgi:quercetin dioxygenase-like cupin family protein
MKRRDFLKFPLAAAALTAMARGADALAKNLARPGRGFRVGSQQDRREAALAIMGGRFDLKVSGQDTGGELCIFDTLRSTKGGPPLHRHQAQDEWFYVLRGEFMVQVGDDTIKLAPGDSAFAPRGIPHTFAMTGEGLGQMLVLFQPAGRMEEFFQQMGALGQGVSAGQQLPKSVWEEHGMELLGPPLKY